MSGKSVLVDTNILIYLLQGDQTAGKLLEEKNIVISFVSEIELISHRGLSSKNLFFIEELLKSSKVVQSNDRINRKAAELRRASKVKFADAIIIATAFVEGIPLITADQELMEVDQVEIIKYYPGSSMRS